MKKIALLLLILLVFPLRAANEIRFPSATGQQKSITIRRVSDGYLWDRVAEEFAQSVVDANRAIDMTEDSNDLGLYEVSFISTAAGEYYLRAYDTNATIFDSNNTYSGDGQLFWDSAEITDYTTKTLIDDVNDFIIAHGDEYWPSNINDVDFRLYVGQGVDDHSADINTLVIDVCDIKIDTNDLKATRGVPRID